MIFSIRFIKNNHLIYFKIMHLMIQGWKLLYWIPLVLISKSLLILCLIVYFGFSCWIATAESSSIYCARKNFKISRLLIGCLNSTIITLIGWIFYTFQDWDYWKEEIQVLILISKILKFSAQLRVNVRNGKKAERAHLYRWVRFTSPSLQGVRFTSPSLQEG